MLRYQSWLYLTLGRLNEALELYKKVVVLDPLHAKSYSQLGYFHYFVGQNQEAEDALRKAAELNPQKEQDHVIHGQILLAEGHPEAGLSEVEKESSPVWKTFGESIAFRALGRNDDSNAALDKLIASHSQDAAYQIATVYAYRGESDKAFQWLDVAYARHDAGLACLKFDPLLNNLRQDPRYVDLVRKMHLRARVGRERLGRVASGISLRIKKVASAVPYIRVTSECRAVAVAVIPNRRMET